MTQANMRCHHPSSLTHPSKTTEASNIFHGTAPLEGVGTKRLVNGSETSHGGEIGFDLTCQVLFSPQFLNVKSGDCYVDAGGGRGNTVIACKLVNPGVRAVSVEIEKERHDTAIQWSQQIPWKSGSSTPEFIHKSFLDESLVDLWKKPRLKVYFANFEMKMMAMSSRNEVGVQFQLENRLSRYCRPGTVVLSFETMFMGDSSWEEESVSAVLGDTDLDWLSTSQIVPIYKYTRKSSADMNVTRKRRREEPLPVLGAALLDDSEWEEGYGKQTYPVAWNAKGKIRFMVEEPYKSSPCGRHSAFEPESTDTTNSTRVLSICKDGIFSASSFIRNVYYVFWTLEDKKEQERFLQRWFYFFNEISLQSHGSAEHLKQSCSYVRPGRYLVGALTALGSKAVYEFGAGKGVLFSLLKMMRNLRGLPVSCDVAVESEHIAKEWSKFGTGTSDNLRVLKKLGVVQYEAKGKKIPTVRDFRMRFRAWKRGVAMLNEEGLQDLTPEILLLVWPVTDDQVFVNCVNGWHAAGGERIAVIYDPKDKESSVPGCFLTEIPGRNWCLMKNVLHDAEGGLKSYVGHMNLMHWGFHSQEIYRCEKYSSYGLYIYQRK